MLEQAQDLQKRRDRNVEDRNREFLISLLY